MVFRIVFFIILFLFLFNFATRDYINPYKCRMYIGKKGSGKSTFLTRTAQKAIKKGRKVYSNCQIVGCELFDIKDLGYKHFQEESIILIDEVSLIWSNRDFRSFDDQHVGRFFRLLRHNHLQVYLFSQSVDVDKKIRDLMDEIWVVTNFMRVFVMLHQVSKRITVSNSLDTDGNVKNGSLVEDYRFVSPLFGGIKFIFIPRWIPFFDTNEYRDNYEPIQSQLLKYDSYDQFNALKLRGFIKWKGKQYVKKLEKLLLFIKKDLFRRKKLAENDIPTFFKVDR